MNAPETSLSTFGYSSKERVEKALASLQAGEIVLLLDDERREDEADLIVAAEKLTPALTNFLIHHGSGIVCLCITEQKRQQLQLPFMVSRNRNAFHTAFTISIEAKEGITTGVSAAERTHTILTAIQKDAQPEDIVSPGHVFPLCAREGGVLTRQGHTEGSVDLAHLAGLEPATVLCELMNPDGTMTRGKAVFDFARQHALMVLTVGDIIRYRLETER